MTTKTGLERVAYTAVGAPMIGARRVKVTTEKLAESMTRRQKSIKASLFREFGRWVDEGEAVVGKLVGWGRSATRSDEVRGARKVAADQVRSGFTGMANRVEKALDLIEPDLALREIPGIGPASADKIHAAGVSGIAGFLGRTSDDDGIRLLADETGISADRIAEWRLTADLGRIDGIGAGYQRMLNSVGIGTLTKLANAEAGALHDELTAIDQPGLPRQAPGKPEVANWIKEARRLSLAAE